MSSELCGSGVLRRVNAHRGERQRATLCVETTARAEEVDGATPIGPGGPASSDAGLLDVEAHEPSAKRVDPGGSGESERVRECR